MVCFMKTGSVDLPLHYGKAPRWLFGRMTKLALPISQLIIDEYGQDEFLKRLSNPYFFQALGCVLGFDWHSSGLTTTVCGALKLALNKNNMGIMVAGGKGKTSRKTPAEIPQIAEKFNLSDKKISQLKYASKIAAKVDNSLIQDHYNLYHHSFFLNDKGKWAVVQQGMRQEGKYARRYHWLSDSISDFIEHENTIFFDKKEQRALDLTASESKETRKISLDLVKDNPVKLKKFDKIKKTNQSSLTEFASFSLPSRHNIIKIDLGNFNALISAYELQPKNYEELIAVKGFGAKTIRALALISSLVYGSKVSWKDPAKYSYAHGGKDGYPEPIDKEKYDQSIAILKDFVKNAKLTDKSKIKCLKRLSLLVK